MAQRTTFGGVYRVHFDFLGRGDRSDDATEFPDQVRRGIHCGTTAQTFEQGTAFPPKEFPRDVFA